MATTQGAGLPRTDGERAKGSLWREGPLRIVILIGVLTTASVSVSMASVPLWAIDRGVPTSSAPLAFSMVLLFAIATQPLVPAIAARVGPRLPLAGGLIVLGAPSLLYGMTSDLWPMLAIAAVRGIGMGLLVVAGTALIATLAPLDRRGEALGTYGFATVVLGLIGVPVGAALAQSGLFGVVWVLAAVPLLAIPAALRVHDWHPRGEAPPVPPRRSRRRLAAIRSVLAPSVMLLAVMVAAGCFMTYLPIARTEGHLATAALLLMGIGAALGRWGTGRVVDRHSLRALAPAASAGAAAGTLLVGVGLGGFSSSDSALILFGSALFGLAYGAAMTATVVASFARVPLEEATTASAMWNISIDGGQAIGPVAAGLIATTALGASGAFEVIGLLVAASVPLALEVGRTDTTPIPESCRA